MKADSPDLNAAAFEHAVLKYLDDAYTLARYLVRSEHDAQDIVQEAAFRAFQHFTGFRGVDAKSWFLAIVRNCCYTWIERQRSRRVVEDGGELLSLVADDREADERAILSSERSRIEAALARLPVELREVVILREIGGLSYKEISSVTGVPAGTVMSRLSRARDRLADLLQPRGGTE